MLVLRKEFFLVVCLEDFIENTFSSHLGIFITPLNIDTIADKGPGKSLKMDCGSDKKCKVGCQDGF